MQLPAHLCGYIFDLDGTLLDSHWVWEAVDEIFLRRHNLKITPEYTKAVAHMGFVNTARYTIEYFGMRETPEQLIEEWHTLSFAAYRDRVSLKPCVSTYLHQLCAQGVHISAATSSEMTLVVPCLKRLGIYDLFEHIITVNDVTRDKSSPDIYLLAAQRMGCCPCDCVVFEDILRGIQSAKSAGFFTVAVQEPASAPDWEQIQKTADRSISSFSELLT